MKAPGWASAIPGGAVGYAYTPSAALWFRQTPEGPLDHDGTPIDLGSAFHVRAFDGRSDLTWERAGAEWTSRELAPAEHGDTLPARSKMWGHVKKTKPGWSYLHEDRIVGFWVPFEATLDSELALRQAELLVIDPFGNTYVAETALIAIEVFDA